jgi:hypothetical protein
LYAQLAAPAKPATSSPSPNDQRARDPDHVVGILPDWAQRLIIDGAPAGRYPSDSEAIFAAERALIDAGATDDEAVLVMMNETNNVSSLVHNHSKNPEKYLRDDFARLRAKSAPRDPPLFTIESWSQARNRAPIEWRVAGLLPARGLALVYGESGIGKSHLALALGVAIARGESFAGLGTQQAAVLYAPTEGEIRDRLRATETHHGIGEPFPPFEQLTSTIALDDATLCAALASVLVRRGQRVVIFDVLADLLGDVEENSASEMRRALMNVKRLAVAIDGLVILVHHAGKSGASERGSSALRGACSAVLKLERTGDRLKLLVEKMRDAAPIDPLFFRLQPVQFDGGLSVVLVPADAAEELVPNNVVDTLRVLNERGSSSGLTFSDWREACTHVSRSTFTGSKTQAGHLTQLERAGLIERRGERGKRGARYRPSPAACEKFRWHYSTFWAPLVTTIEPEAIDGPAGQSQANGLTSPKANRSGQNPISMDLAHGPNSPHGPEGAQ